MEENVMKKMDMEQDTGSALNLEAVQEQIAEIRTQMESLSKATPDNKLSMIVFSGDLDKVLASFVIATGAVAMGMEVVMFFTFWGTPVLRDKMKKVGGKDIMGKMFGTMLPKGTGAVKLSKMNMGGMGTVMMKNLMKKKFTITLCASTSFYKKLIQVETDLEKRGYKILAPDLAAAMHKRNDYKLESYINEFYAGNYRQGKGKFIRDHFDKIAQADAILVINLEKKGIPGYIGPNVLMEMGLAFFSVLFNTPGYDINRSHFNFRIAFGLFLHTAANQMINRSVVSFSGNIPAGNINS